MERLARFWRHPGGAGIVIAVVCVPLIFLLGDNGWLVPFVALCVYPAIDVPHILTRRSWWWGATVSLIVWIVLFGTLVGIADSVHHIGEGAMVFLLPFMMYPAAFGISALVRLEGRLNGRPVESGPRVAQVIGGIALLLFVGVPMVSNMIPFITENATGNTPENMSYTADGEVVATAPGTVTVRFTNQDTKIFHLGPQTEFDFRGPAWRMNTSPAGPTLLAPGQRVGVDWVNRNREPHAQLVTIWVERKGCAGDATWTAASQSANQTPASPVVARPPTGVWESWLGTDAPQPQNMLLLEFSGDGKLAYQSAGRERHTGGEWRQQGDIVTLQLGDCAFVYHGQIVGNSIRGEFASETHEHSVWTARRRDQ